MKKLLDVLENKQDIEVLSAEFGFENTRLFFENVFPDEPMPLNLVVDPQNAMRVENRVNLLEAQLIKQLDVDVVVLFGPRITNPVFQEKVQNGSIVLSASMEEIRQHIQGIHWKKDGDVEVKLPEQSDVTFNRRLKLGEKFLSEQKQRNVAEQPPLSFFESNKKRKASPDQILDELLDADNRCAAKKVLLDVLPDELLQQLLEKLHEERANEESVMDKKKSEIKTY